MLTTPKGTMQTTTGDTTRSLTNEVRPSVINTITNVGSRSAPATTPLDLTSTQMATTISTPN